LLHIVDASDTERQWRVEQVNQVLADIGAAEVGQIIIYNKIDRLNDCPARCERDSEGKVTKIWLSAVSGAGIDLLYGVLSEQLSHDRVRRRVRVPVSAGDLRARLFAEALVLDEQYADNGDSLLEIQISAQHFTQLVKSDSRLQPIEEN